MPVCRVIFRLDFKPNFEILDRPGTVLRVLKGLGENYWDEFQDATQTRSLSGTFKGKGDELGLYRSLSVDPSMINFSIEAARGIGLKSMETNPSYAILFKAVHELCDTFKINSFERAGIRIFYMNSLGPSAPNLVNLFGASVDKELVGPIQTHLGQMADIGIQIDGMHEDKIKYHFRMGPYAKVEAKKYYEHVHEQIAERPNDNFICDADLYEEKFSLKDTRVIVWTRPLLARATNLIEEIEKTIVQRCERTA